MESMLVCDNLSQSNTPTKYMPNIINLNENVKKVLKLTQF